MNSLFRNLLIVSLLMHSSHSLPYCDKESIGQAQTLGSINLQSKKYIDKHVQATLHYMQVLNFRVRDTYHHSQNYDDFFGNNRLNGPRLLKVLWKDNGFSDVAGKSYKLDGFQSLAYDRYTIRLANKFENTSRHDVLVHELTHFLQETTTEEELSYINFNGDNYYEYISQDSEYEAHLVQIAYIIENQRNYFCSKVSPENQKNIINQMKNLISTGGAKLGIPIILISKEEGLI